MADLKPATDAEMQKAIDEINPASGLGTMVEGTLIEAMVAEIRMHRDAATPHLLRAVRLYTDELGALRKRVAELEALHEAAARANEALESIGEQARRRIAELEEQERERDHVAMERDTRED